VAGNACTEMKEIGAREGTKVERAMGDKLGFLQIFEFGETSIKFQFFFFIEKKKQITHRRKV
jgi:hypothetical protein